MSEKTRESLVTRQELESLVVDYRRLLAEHRRARPQSHTRRRLGQELLGLSSRFERLLSRAAVDEETRAQWHARLHHASPAPSGPEPGTPIAFCGRSETGSELVIRRLGPRELDLLVDGTRVERLTAAEELCSNEPGLVFRVGDQLYHETFGASAAALAELRGGLEEGQPAPADRELLLDGLVDRDLGLTPRGRRALTVGSRAHTEPTGRTPIPIGIVTRGPVGERERARLRAELVRCAMLGQRRPVFVRGALTYEENPSLAQPAVANATLDLGGRTVRAHAAAAGMSEAIDQLVEHLRRALRELRGRDEADRREPVVAEPGQWRHGNLPPAPEGPLPDIRLAPLMRTGSRGEAALRRDLADRGTSRIPPP